MSPHLFNIYAEHVMRKALKHHPTGIAVGGKLVNNLRYADDIVLVAKSMQELQDLTNRVKTASEAAGLFLNVSKTKVMKVTKSPNNESLTVNNQNVKTVKVSTTWAHCSQTHWMIAMKSDDASQLQRP